MRFLLLLLLLQTFWSQVNAVLYDTKKCGKDIVFTSFDVTDNDGIVENMGNIVPWAAYIQIKNEENGSEKLCGGTLISNRHVLTAAHCFGTNSSGCGSKKALSERFCEKDQHLTDAEILSNTVVTVGALCSSLNTSNSCSKETLLGKRMRVQKFQFGQYYENNCLNGDDLAILELESPIDNIEGANYVCLPFFNHFTLAENFNVTASGWGADPAKGLNSLAPVVQILDLSTEPLQKCANKWENGIPPDAFCAEETEEKGICEGDTGGGFTTRDIETNQSYLISVVSYGSDCQDLIVGKPPKAVISTDIRFHEKFILNFMAS